MFTLWEVIEAHHAGGQPFGIRLLCCKPLLDLFVVNDAAFSGVDEEHTSRLQAALRHDLFGLDFDYADFGRHHYKVVVGHPVATWTKTVAIEHRANDFAIGEGDTRWSIPWLHEGCVVAVEVASILIHVRIVFPSFGNHHEDGVLN